MAGIGRFTGVSLADMMPLCMPWDDINGRLQPVFSGAAAKLSLELASTAYDLNVDAWREAGWRDISYQVDNTLLTGPTLNRAGSGGLGGAISDYFQFLAQARLKRINPISQIRGALRQKENVDTCKAVVMLHPLSAGRYLVAIGFMGTGKRLYDWVSNFRLSEEEGMHAGFLQLTKEFEKNCGAISFPETAQELHLPQLTLSDILAECAQPSSRFRIWMAGHSQGGAVMQLFAYRAIRAGVLRQHMTGYGFASPSAVYTHPACDLSAFPLFHILNAYDVFPKMGALLHIGQCRIAYPDEKMRAACYRAAWQDPVYRAVSVLLRGVKDCASGFLLVLSVVKALENVPSDDAMAVLNGFVGSFIPERLLGPLGSRKEEILLSLSRKLTESYHLASGGRNIPSAELSLLQKRVLNVMDQFGPRSFSKAVMQYISLSHKLRGETAENGAASYQYIVNQGLSSLRQKVWYSPACCLFPGERSPSRRLGGSRFAQFSRMKDQRKHRRLS